MIWRIVTSVVFILSLIASAAAFWQSRDSNYGLSIFNSVPPSNIFTQVLTGPSSSAFQGYSIRQVVSTAGNSLGTLSVTLAVSGAVKVNNASYCVQSSGYVCTATPTELLFGGGHGFTFSGAAGTPASITSDWTSFSTSGTNIIVIMDMDNATADFVMDQSGLTGPTCYLGAALSSYNQASPAGSYAAATGFVCAVGNIMTAANAPNTLFGSFNDTDCSCTVANTSIRAVVPITGSSIGRISASFLTGTAGTLQVDHASICVQSTTYNCVAPPVELLFSGGHGFTAAANTVVTSDYLPFSVSSGYSVVIIADFNVSTPGSASENSGSGGVDYWNSTSGGGATYNLQNPPATFSTDATHNAGFNFVWTH